MFSARNITKTIMAAAMPLMLSMTVAAPAEAQLNNRPYSFKNSPDGGIGMSNGGRQAIINQKLFDLTPDNLHRDASGNLVDIVRGPGRSAIAFRHGTSESLPHYRGTSFRGEYDLMEAGIFNSFFGPHYDVPYYGGGSGIGYGGNSSSNTIDSWTSFVAQLDR
jgi:hypothetical protein